MQPNNILLNYDNFRHYYKRNMHILVNLHTELGELNLPFWDRYS